MKSLRRASTQHLLAMIVSFAVLAAGVTAIAFAAGNGGPTPAAKPLDAAVHDALAAPSVQGVTARIRFTNNLINASSLRGRANALLTGADGRLWASNDGRLRLELQSDAGDAQLLVDNDTFKLYDASSNIVYEGNLPGNGQKTAEKGAGDQPPSLKRIQDEIAKLAERFTVSAAEPSNVAGHEAYTVRLAPRHDGGLLGAGELAWDAATGTPLRAAIYAAGASKPVLELAATHISFGPVDSSALDVTPPAGAKVVKVDTQGATGAGGHAGEKGTDVKPVTGAKDVQAALPFQLAAPDTLAGLPRKDVRLLHIGDAPSALVTYGQGLGGIAVIESAASSKGGGGAATPNQLELPKLSIDGATGTELATALGTVVRFDRGSVSYTVAGAVPAAAAEAAARGL